MFNHITLKILMIENDINSIELASKLGVSMTTISHWLSGKHEPRAEYLPGLSKVFNIKQGELLK